MRAWPRNEVLGPAIGHLIPVPRVEGEIVISSAFTVSKSLSLGSTALPPFCPHSYIRVTPLTSAKF